MAAEYSPQVLEELGARVAAGLPRWGLSPATTVELLNVSENATYALRDPVSARELILRLHRVGYSSAQEIRAELAWMEALRREGVLDTAAAEPGLDGDAVQTLESRGAAVPRFAVAFERLPGREPAPRDAVRWFGRLGETTAWLHEHASSWVLPPGFCRKRWDFDAMVGPAACWGPWRAGTGLDAAGVLVLERTLDLIRARLDRYGQGADVFGLVHADLRLANLLVDGADLRVIDFDDCGFSWFLYDFATSVSFIEHEALVPDLLRAWLSGYRRVRSLPADAAAEMPTFVMLRRILLTAWLASHAEVPLAREMGERYTAGTVALGLRWLDGSYLNSTGR